MSNGGPEATSSPMVPEWDRLELTIRRLLDEHDAWRRRAGAAEQRVRELEAALNELSTGNLDPLALSEQVRSYERDNRGLVKRLAQAREAVERIQSRLQFLEEDR